jgi:hypothetical protein
MLKRAYQAVTAGMGRANGAVYTGEVWPQVLQSSYQGKSADSTDLDKALGSLAQRVEQESGLFCHQGVKFAPYFAAKIRSGIGLAMLRLGREIRAIDEMLELLNPSLVVTPFGRRAHMALGELAQRRQTPGLLISHGTFTPMKNDLEEMGWIFHSYGLMYGSYTHSALQTPQAEKFSKQVSTPAKFSRTGPLVFGHSVNRETSEKLRPRLLAGREDCRVVVHAGTPKGRGRRHFHVFENPDEYVTALADLVWAVDQLPDVYLIIKFRPLELAVEELRSLLPQSSRYYISVEERFPDVLGLADLLVSFSSTTIEESLLNQVPVMLYGGGGRYQHLEALEVTPDAAVEPRAVYAVRRAEHLPDALRRILDTNGRAPLPEELFRPYAYTKDQVTPFPQLVRDLAGA